MASLVKAGDKVINLDAVAYIEPDVLSGYRVYFLAPDTGVAGTLAYLILSERDAANLIAAAEVQT